MSVGSGNHHRTGEQRSITSCSSGAIASKWHNTGPCDNRNHKQEKHHLHKRVNKSLLFQTGTAPLDPAASRFWFSSGLNPTDPLVACQQCNVLPGCELCFS